MKLVMDVLPGEYSIHRFDAEYPIPAAVLEESLFAGFRSEDELSGVTRSSLDLESEAAAPGRAMLKVRGPLDLGLKGIMARISRALADADVAVFVISSYDTDYVMVPSGQLSSACAALIDTGIDVSHTAAR